PAPEEKSADDAMAFPKPAEVDETWQMPKPEPWDLGPPLVDDVAKLKPLDPEKPVWLDVENKSVVFVGKVCQREVPLELFACIRHTKEHEAIVVADLTAITVHAGLLAAGAEPGNPVQYNPEYIPARGTEIEVTLRWKDAQGKVQTARAQDWIQNTKTGEAMTEPWVFGGSGFWVEPGGEKIYQAQGGDFICVANFGTAMLDVPVESSYANNMLMYRAFTERIPPLETPVTILLTPKPNAKE
ncbi:MAG: YdjY domain-containing protein, partial [Patescibacteria group bacterium]|nr:YdjY domain-containing protein [Patescibacteria group bacterium]